MSATVTATRNGRHGAAGAGGGATLDTLLSAMDSASAEDLEKLRAQIAAEEAKLEALVAGHRKRIDGLKNLAKMLDVRINGWPVTRVSNGAGLSPLGKKIRKWMRGFAGPHSPAEIAEATGKSLAAVHAALQKPAFVRREDGRYELAEAGTSAESEEIDSAAWESAE